MLDAYDRFFDGQGRFTFIDPHPERLLGLLTTADKTRCQVLKQRVQEVSPAEFRALGENDILFVDSSHVSKLGSDVNYLFFDVLPVLNPGVLVHFHDIFWPFEYPAAWIEEGRAWNEAYLVRAFLQHNREYEVLLFPSYLERHEPDLLRTFLPLTLKRSPQNPDVGGASLWLRKRGPGDCR